METSRRDTSLHKDEFDPLIKCPQCGSKRVWKDGLRYLSEGGDVQRFLCRSCGYRFSQTSSKSIKKFKEEIDVAGQSFPETSSSVLDSSDIQSANSLSGQKRPNDLALLLREYVRPQESTPLSFSTAGKDLNTFVPNGGERRVCVSKVRAKNLAKTESRTEKRAAGATKLASEDIKSKIIEFAWWLKKEGYAESTITRRVKILKTLIKRGANPLEPESFKLTLAKQEGWSPTTKEHAVTAYTSFLKMHGGTWEPPKYRRVGKLPFIPTETEIDQLIASCNRKTSTFLQLLKETGARSGEAWQLEWTDFDFENRSVRITPEKGGDPRVLRISDKLVAMLKALPKDFPKPFQGSLRHFARSFRRQRKRATYKLQNRRIEKITFHTLRHWKATMEYHRTKDILHVKELLGHKSIQNTLIYTHLVNFEDDQFTCRVARTLQEAQSLIEVGFDYVTEMDGVKLFRKRK